MSALLSIAAFSWSTDALAPAKVEFQRDIQPILKANCYGRRGPSQQMNNFRLDRRRDAMRYLKDCVSMGHPGELAHDWRTPRARQIQA